MDLHHAAVTLPQAVEAFNSLYRAPKTPSGEFPNHWHISIRYVPLEPPGHLVFIVQPDSHTIFTQGPLEKILGNTLGQTIAQEEEATSLVVRWILESFRMADPQTGRPWSWSTNDEGLAKRVLGAMRELGVDEALLDMPVAGAEENDACDGMWEQFLEKLEGPDRLFPSCPCDLLP